MSSCLKILFSASPLHSIPGPYDPIPDNLACRYRQRDLQFRNTGFERVKKGWIRSPAGDERVDENTYLINKPGLKKHAVERSAAIHAQDVHAVLRLQICQCCTHINTLSPATMVPILRSSRYRRYSFGVAREHRAMMSLI